MEGATTSPNNHVEMQPVPGGVPIGSTKLNVMPCRTMTTTSTYQWGCDTPTATCRGDDKSHICPGWPYTLREPVLDPARSSMQLHQRRAHDQYQTESPAYSQQVRGLKVS